MEPRHLIDEVVFDISFESDATALEHQDDINALLYDSLLPVVDEICSRYSDTDTVLRLDVVEIDMGDVPHVDFKAEMARRIREKLGDVLRDKRAQAGAAASTGSSISRQHSELAQLETFLKSGSLPWQADIKDDQVHERMLERVIEAGSAAELIALMERADDRKALVRRLVSQFSDRHLAGLLRQLMPSQAEALLALIDDFRRVFKEYGLAGTALRESVRQVWQQMIEMISNASATSVDTEVLVRSVVKKIASSHGQKRAHTLALMANAAQRLKRDKEIGPTLARLLAFQEQRSDTRYDEQEAPAFDESGFAEAASNAALTDDASLRLKDTTPASLRHRIAQALLGGDANYINPIWDELVREYPELLREALRHYGARAEVRHRIAAGFSDAMMRDILYLLQPLAEDFLTPLLDHPEPFRTAAGAAAGESREAWIEGLWEASLEYLLAAQGSGFDPRDYVANLLEQMAGADRALRPALAQAWRDEAPAGARDELTQILQDMQMLQPAEPAASEGTAGNNSDVLLRGYDLHERLRHLLNPQAGIDIPDSLTALIDALAAQHPAQLRRVFRELRSGELSLARARLADHEWERLLTACIALDSASGDGSAFLRAINTHAQRAVDKGAYFRRVLDDLLHERAVDLEAVLQDSEAARDASANESTGQLEHSDPHRAVPADDQPRDTDILPSASRKQSDAEKLQEFLRRDVTLGSGDSASLAATMERMLAHSANPLRELLASSVVVPDLAARLARFLPERLLTRILLLLRSTEHYAVQYCADGVADAFCLTHANIAADDIARLKWQFIFSHLFENRQAFAQARFVDGLKDYLVRRAGVADSSEARDALERHVARNLAFIEPLSSLSQEHTRQSAAPSVEKDTAGNAEVPNEALPASSPKDNEVPLRDMDADPASLRHRVAQAILSGDAAGIRNVWDELLQLYPELLRDALRHYGVRAEVRYGIAAGFPDAMLRDILQLLEPQAAALAALLLDDPAAIDTGEAWIDGLWEAALDYLLGARSAGFDAQVFAGSLLKRMADGDRTLYRVLAQTWRTAASAAMNQEFARILESLLQAEVAGADSDSGTASASEVLLRGYDLHDMLRQRLLPATRPDGATDEHEPSDALIAAIDTLAASHPAQLQRLFRELRSGALSPADARLGAGEWQRLVAAFIALDFAADVGTGLQRAVDDHALHAGDRASYFRQVLDDLLHGRPLDLEAITERSGALADAAADTQAPDIGTARDADRSGIQHRVVQALLRGDASGIQNIWSELLQDYPAMLRDVLRRYGVRPEVRRGMAEGFPETILSDMTRLLEPRSAAFMTLLNSDPALSYMTGAAGGSRDEWKRRLWDGSFASLLAVDSVSFEPRAYIGRMLEQIAGADRTHHRVLAQAWRNAAAPGGAGAPEELVRILDAILAEANAAAEKKPAPDPRNAAWSQGAGLHEILRRRLLPGGGAADASNNLGAVISTLAARYPEQLQGIYRELRSGDLSLAGAQLGDDEWRRLAAVFVALDPAFGNRGEFLRAVEAHAQRAGNKANYFRQVLDALVQERPIDLEEILAQSGPDETAVRSSTQDAAAARDADVAPSGETSQRAEEEEKNAPASVSAAGLLRGEDTEPFSLRHSLAQTLISGDAAGVLGVWDELLREHRELLRDALRHYGARAEVRQRIAAGFSDAMLRDITRVLEAQAEVVIAPLLDDPARFYRAGGAAHGSVDVWKRRLWESSLHQLVTTPAGGFDPHAYIGSLLERMMGADRKSSLALAQAWRDAVPAGMRDVFTRILETGANGQALGADKEGAAEVHGDSLYEALRSRLSGAGSAETTGGLNALLDALTTRHPDQLQQIYRELRSGELSLEAATLADDEWRRLAAVLIALDPVFGAQSVFLRAIDAHAQRAANKANYFRQVLNTLMHGRPIDLEAIVLQSRQDETAISPGSMQTAARPDHAGDRAGKSAALLHSEDAEDTGPLSLRHRLAQALLSGEAAGIHTVWDELIRDHRELLREALRHYGAHAEVRRRIAAGFSDAMLKDISRVLDAQAEALIAPLLDDPARYYRVGGAAHGSPEAWKRLLWESSLHQLLTTQAGGFDAQAYVSSVLERMAGADRTAYRVLAEAWRDAVPAEVRDAFAAILEKFASDALHGPTTPAGDGSIDGTPGTPHESPETAPPPSRIKPDEEILRTFLQRDIAPSSADLAMIVKLVEQMLAQGAPALRELLESSLRTPHIAARFVYSLPERLLTRALLLLRSAEHYAVQQCADSVADAFSLVHSGVAPSRIVQWKWHFIFSYLFEQAQPFLQARFASGLTDYLVAQSGVTNIRVARDALDRRVALTLAAQTDFAAQTQTSEADAAAAAEKARRQAAKSREARRKDKEKEKAQEEPDQGEKIHILNAGQVLASPYLPRLFAMLNLTASGAFVDRQAAERAVHLLQFMVNESVTSPEYQLVLNKILCGVKTGIPIVPEIEITAHEKNVVEGLIQGMIQNWKTIGTTSVKGLRESFLQREGWLRLEDDAWQLQVQPGTFDMLLDRLPWSFSIIKYPWMERAVHVTWR